MIKNCPMRHENGNCIPAGGFCTANKNICEALHNAYRMGKAQLFSEGTTSDLISKTEVVKHLRRMLESTVPNTDYDEGFIDGVEFGISTVSTMPPAQSQSTTGQLNDGARSTAQSTDLIDRGQAIEKFAMTAPQMSVIRIYEAVEILESMPTIQPEPPIIKCKDCKWWRKQKDSAQGRCRLLGIYPTGAWYCGNAERRTE